jgi:hypothetical protein
VHAQSTNASGQYDYDLFTIGAGSGGVRGSRFASSYGEQWPDGVLLCRLPHLIVAIARNRVLARQRRACATATATGTAAATATATATVTADM